VIEIVRKITGRKVVARDDPRRPGDPAHLVVDPTKAREILVWTPERSDLATIVADAWRWHLKCGAASVKTGV
jgi:UDP-glucose 4-epimerase